MGKALRERTARRATGERRPQWTRIHECELPPRVATSLVRCDGCGHIWRYEESRKRYLRLNRADRREIARGYRRPARGGARFTKGHEIVSAGR